MLRTRTTLLQAHTHQFLGTFGGSGNGDYRAELKRALQVITKYAATRKLLPSQILVRVDGLYGNAAVLRDVLDTNLGFIGRSRDYALLDLAAVQAVLACPPWRCVPTQKVEPSAPCTIAQTCPWPRARLVCG